jgi:capsular exopolysaccharide synthesis family protein
MSTETRQTQIVPAAGAHAIQPYGGPPAAAAPDVPTMSAGDVWRVVKQRKLFIAVTFILAYLLVCGATVAVYVFWPAYTAEGYFQLEPPRAEDMGIEPAMVDPRIMQLQLESEAQKMTHLGVLQDVLSQPEIQQTEYYKWYARHGEDSNDALYDLEWYLHAAPLVDTTIIRISLACADPVEARTIVKTFMDRYWLRYRENATRYYTETKESLGASRSGLQSELDEKQKTMSSFRQSVDIPHMESESSLVSDHLGGLRQQISLYQAQASALQAQLNEVQRLGRDLPLTPEMKIIVESDPVLRFWRQQVEMMDVQIASSIGRLMGDNHRQMKILRSQRDGYAQLEAAKREELMNDLRERELNNLRQNVISVQNALLSLQEDYREQEARRQDIDRHLQTYLNMKSEEERMQEELKEIETAYRTADHALKDRNRVRLQIAQYPIKPLKPSRPNLPLYLGGGFLVAMLCAFGLAFLREFTDTAIRTPVDVVRHGRLAVLGAVPVLDDEQAAGDQIEEATRKAPHSLVAESFRQIRTNLLFSGASDTQRSILITSPAPEDGKTAIAVNLAVSMARGNQRVLLIDCNFRRPAIRQIFSNTKSDGLSNILVGQSTLDKLVTKTDMPNLDVLTSGPMPPAPAELLGTTYMKELIAEAVKKYDHVILDGPPVLLVSDSLVLANQVDGVILVTRAVRNTKGALKRARELLHNVGARILGGVLNGVQLRPGGYFRRQYREFYDYSSDYAAPRELPVGRAEKSEDEPDLE